MQNCMYFQYMMTCISMADRQKIIIPICKAEKVCVFLIFCIVSYQIKADPPMHRNDTTCFQTVQLQT